MLLLQKLNIFTLLAYSAVHKDTIQLQQVGQMEKVFGAYGPRQNILSAKSRNLQIMILQYFCLLHKLNE